MIALNKNNIVFKALQPMFAVVANILLAYIVYFVARVAYLLENYSLFKEGLSFEHLIRMFQGGLMFDTTAIVYCNDPNTYHRFCRGLFVIVNAIG